MTDPNWLALIGLVYLGCGIIFFALSLNRGAALAGLGAERQAVAAAHQSYGVNFASLLGLIGLVLQGTSQFSTLAFGPTVILLLSGLIVLLVLFVFAADYLAEPGVSDIAAYASADQQRAAAIAGRSRGERNGQLGGAEDGSNNDADSVRSTIQLVSSEQPARSAALAAHVASTMASG